MKRFIVLASTLFISTSIFASDFMDDLSDAGGVFVLLFIIMLVWGVLEIILFFKIWGMTNDVKAIKKDMFNENAFTSDEELAQYIRKNIVLGNVENVKRILMQNFMDTIQRYHHQLLYNGLNEIDDKGYSHIVKYTNDEIMSMTIIPFTETLQMQFDIVGGELPIYIQNMKTVGDFFSLFQKENLKYHNLPKPEVKKEE